MKKISVFVIALALLVCSSCYGKFTGTRLNKPEVTVFYDHIEWDYDKSASYYLIVAGEKKYKTDLNSFVFEQGLKTLKIKAVGDGKYFLDSAYVYVTLE